MRSGLLFSLLLVTSPGYCQHFEAVDRAKTRLQELFKERGFPGATVGIVWADGKSATFSVGKFEKDKDKPLLPSDRMLAGSIGKTFVAASFLRVAKEKSISLDEKVSKYLGDRAWFKELPNAPGLTLRSLMNHTSGIPEHVQSPAFTDLIAKDPLKVWKYEDLLVVTRGAKPLATAGEKFSYADTNYIILGLVLEKIAGKAMYTLVNDWFIKPLKLDRTIPSDKLQIPDLAVGFATFGPFFARGPMVKDGKMVFNPQMEWCGGGFASTALDLAKWSMALYGGSVLSPETETEMLRGVDAGPLGQYGLGVQIRKTPLGISYGHGGWFPGWLSEMEYFPDHGIAVAIQFNTDDFRQLGRSTHGYLVELMRAVLDKKL
ncbi:MAG: beta-lactamase family protein [Chlorobia bacterium]|nr:beta-lactamase family protein [Fimbriimonadaceae bacterium]